jgi:hypothetical protein
MCRDPERLRDKTAGAQPRDRGYSLPGGETEAVHAAVDLEPGPERLRAAPGIQQRELLVLVDERLKLMMCGGFEFSGVAEALEQHDACRTPRLAQRHGLLDARDREGIRSRKRLGHPDKSVAIGVRLDDRDDATAGGEFANPREVMPERCRVDDSAQRRAQNAPSP